MGTSSVRYEVGLFAQGEEQCAARGHFVHVYVDRDTRRPVDTPRIVVAVDELADLIQSGGRPVEQMLSRLAQRGREAGAHADAAAAALG